MDKLDFFRTQDLSDLFSVSRQTVFLWRLKGILPEPTVKASLPLWTFGEVKNLYGQISSSLCVRNNPNNLAAYFG